MEKELIEKILEAVAAAMIDDGEGGLQDNYENFILQLNREEKQIFESILKKNRIDFEW